MIDTVTRLLALADVYADRFHEDRKRHTPETVHDRSAARIVLQDELVRLFTPLSDEQIKQSVGAGGEYWASSKIYIKAIFQAAEKAHGIGGES